MRKVKRALAAALAVLTFCRRVERPWYMEYVD